MQVPQIEITEKAAEVFLRSFRGENLDPESTYIRVGANSGGCSGYRWELSTDENKNENDLTFSSQHVNIIVNQKLFEEVIGPVTIDYTSKNLVEQGFVFIREGQQCGCGESFTPYI
tara:strand:+ start:1438 stop:1785 length:348 start_codon:yes stop_codon:yes gene_type:complete